jgi:glycosyltransferase involved in cell wall biosynthesis
MSIVESAERARSEQLRVTIFIPTLNEIEGLRAILPRIKRDWYDEFIVVDGGSTDGTIEYLREQGITVQLEERKGIVNAYCQAFRASTGDIFVAIQGDGNCMPELIPDLVREARKGYDIVFVSRYLPPAKSYDDGTISAIGNHIFTRIINLLFGGRYTDALGGFRAYRRSAVELMALDSMPDTNWLSRRFDLLNTWEVGGCIRAAKLKLRVHEIPGDEPKRIGGRSNVSVIRNGLMIVAQILHELWIGRRFATSSGPAQGAARASTMVAEDQVGAARTRSSGM